MLSSATTPRFHRQAIVIGAGIAGLLSARVLIDYFEHVTVIDRDQLPSEPVDRAGVPQGHHTHILLVQGQRVLEELIPGIGATIRRHGGHQIDIMEDLRVCGEAGWLPVCESGLLIYPSTRSLIEWLVRQELQTVETIRFLEGHEVVGLLPGNAHNISGVVTRRRGFQGKQTLNLEAGLVVDASGRDSHASHWLRAHGFQTPRETVVNPFVSYASRYYRASNGSGWKSLYIQERPPSNLRGGIIWPVEGDRWLVTLSGSGHQHPPTDEAGFLEFSRSLPDPALYEAIRGLKPLSPIVGYRRTDNRWRHFDELRHVPDNFLLLGDAVCALNPVYGQGMAVAAIEALILQRCLKSSTRQDLHGFSRRFQVELAGAIRVPWVLATSSDYRVPGVEAKPLPLSVRLMHMYLSGIIHLMPNDPKLYRLFVEVTHLLRPPRVLLGPSTAAKVFKWTFSRHRPRLTGAGGADTSCWKECRL
jgi:2-polyprenyl-6-methoxyphenol hydroxylase-like FAD-dependent oxidoreductase